jgi:hypothetical protein
VKRKIEAFFQGWGPDPKIEVVYYDRKTADGTPVNPSSMTLDRTEAQRLLTALRKAFRTERKMKSAGLTV